MNFIHYCIESHLLQLGFSAAQKSNCISLVRLLPLLQSENFVTSSLFSNFQHLCLGPALRANLPLLPTPPTSTHRPAFGPTFCVVPLLPTPPLWPDLPSPTQGRSSHCHWHPNGSNCSPLKTKTTFLSSRFSTCPISRASLCRTTAQRAVCWGA